jgi:hypothetical protein
MCHNVFCNAQPTDVSGCTLSRALSYNDVEVCQLQGKLLHALTLVLLCYFGYRHPNRLGKFT